MNIFCYAHGRLEHPMRTPFECVGTFADGWVPPSKHLHLLDGIWRPEDVSDVSYPEHGNEICFQVEDRSYWFAHRNSCILQAMKNFPPFGMFYDLGGGNGFVSAALQEAGQPTVLVEPGSGAVNAMRRGVAHVVQTTIEGARFEHGSLFAAGAFDVLEHIKDDAGFLGLVSALLQPGGRFYCTVPAAQCLWSQEDLFAGHHRRYSAWRLRQVLEQSGLRVEFVSHFFSWLVAPIFVFRTLPFILRGRRDVGGSSAGRVQSDHALPTWLASLADAFHRWELKRLRRSSTIPFGSSLLCVARKPAANLPT
jgi:SAM-dependent methyltransferase